MEQDDAQVKVRLPQDLREWLKRQAAVARRSLTAEVVVALETYRKQQEAHATAHA